MFFFYKCTQEVRVPISSLRHNQQWKIPPTNQEYSKGKVWAGICFFWCNTDKKQLHILIQIFHIFTCNIYLIFGKFQEYFTYKILFSINLRVILWKNPANLHVFYVFLYKYTCNWDIMINCVAGEDNGAGHDNTINPYKEDKKLPT